MEDQKESLIKRELSSELQIVQLQKQNSSQVESLQREHEQLISSQYESQQPTIQQLLTQTEIKSVIFENFSQKNEDNQSQQKLSQLIDQPANEIDEKQQENDQIKQIVEWQQDSTSVHVLQQQSSTIIFDNSSNKENSNNNKKRTKNNEKRKQKSTRIYPQLNQLNDQRQIQRNKVKELDQTVFDSQEKQIFKFQKNPLFNFKLNEELQIETQSVQELTPNIPNLLVVDEFKKQDTIINFETQQPTTQQQNQTIQNKSRKKCLIISFFAVCVILISLGVGLGLFLEKDKKIPEENFLQLQHKINNTIEYSFQSHTTQITKQKDGKQSVTETVIEHKVNLFCKNATEEGFELFAYLVETRIYEVGKEKEMQIKPGVLDFFNRTFQGRVLIDQSNQYSSATDMTNHTFNTTHIDIQAEDDFDKFTVPQNFPFTKEVILLSRAEIVAFNISKSGEIQDVAFPISLESSFLYFIPKLLSTLSPSVLKEDYTIVNEQSGQRRILQEGKKITRKNIEGEVVIDKMEKHDTEDGGIKLVQAHSQTTHNTYAQKTESIEQTKFNEDGQLITSETSAFQQTGNPNNQEDLINGIDIKQTLRVQFLKQTAVTEDAYNKVFSVYGLMGKFGMKWDIFFQVLNKMRENTIKNTNLTQEEQKEQPLVAENQQVDTSGHTTRLLSQNGDLLENLNVELFSKSILSIPVKSFISFKCQKPDGPTENDKCRTQIFLSFLNINIPVSPVKDVNFPMTKFKNGINWFRKNVLLIVQNIKSTVIDEINDIEQTILNKIGTLEKLFSKIDSPYLDQLSEDIQTITQQLFSKVQAIESQLLTEYGYLKDAMKTLISDYEEKVMSGIQESILKAKNFLPIFQSEVQNSIKNIEDIIKSKKDMINSETLNEIKDLIKSIKNTKQILIEEKLNNLTQGILYKIQDQLSSFIDQIMNYFNLKQDFLEQQKDSITQEMKNKINQIIKTSLTTLLSKPFVMLNEKLQETITNTDKKLQQNITLVKQDLDQKINDIEQKVNSLEVKMIDTSEDFLLEIQEQKQYFVDILEQYIDDFIPDQLIQRVQQNLNLINYTLSEDLPKKVESISKIFQNLISSLTNEFKSILTNLKTKAKDISQDIISTIESYSSSIMSQFDGIQNKLEEYVENFFKILKVDFNSQDIQKNVKTQLNKLKNKFVDDPNDVPLPSKNRNLALGNLFDMSILSFVSEIKEFSTQGVQKIKNTVKQVTNLKNTFDDFSGKLNEVFIQPFEFSNFLKLDLRLDGDLEDIINGEELLSLFKQMIDGLKQEFVQFAKTEILETVQKSGIDLIKNQFKQLGDTLVKSLFDKTLGKLFDSNKLFEVAITKISQLFKYKFEEVKLFEKNIKLPQQPQTYYIPTPIGVPLQLSYCFIFEASISYQLGIEGLAVTAGFNVSSNAIFEASAALSVIIAEAGVVVQGHLLKIDLQAQLNLAIYPKFSGTFKVSAKFKALSLYVAVYFSYIKLDIELKCIKIFRRDRRQRNLGWFSSLIGGLLDILRYPIKIITTQFEIYKNFLTKGEVCIPIPKITHSEKIPILPPLIFNGPEIEKVLFKFQI